MNRPCGLKELMNHIASGDKFKANLKALPSKPINMDFYSKRMVNVTKEVDELKARRALGEVPIFNPPPSFFCSVCKQSSTLRCFRCLGAHYCSVDCQRHDWKNHKKHCKEAEELKKSIDDESGYRTVEAVDAAIIDDMINAELGDATARFNLGLAYCAGMGVPLDKAEGRKWIKLSAQSGNEKAAAYLANETAER